MTNLDTLRREQAARLLAILQEARAMTEIAESMALSQGDWQHPATLERIELAQVLERTLSALLAVRAPAPRPPSAAGQNGRP